MKGVVLKDDKKHRNFLLLILSFCCNIYGQDVSATIGDSTVQAMRMAGLCKAWGLVKYYHRYAGRKKINWDEAFTGSYAHFKNANDFESYNQQLKSLLSRAMLQPGVFSKEDEQKAQWILNGRLSSLDNFKILNDTSTYIHQPDFSWIGNDTVFSKEIQHLLFRIVIDYEPFRNRYLGGNELIIHKEDPYSDLDSVDEAHRMLALCRYWNIIHYFFPYKELTDKHWDSVLTEYIPKFQKPHSYYNYFQRIRQLVSEINDSHASGTYIDRKKGLWPRLSEEPKADTSARKSYPVYLLPPFTLEVIDSNVVIHKILNDSLEKSGSIQRGDILLKVNDKEVNDVASAYRTHSPHSTQQSFRSQARHNLIYYLSDTTTFDFVLRRDDETLAVNDVIGENYMVIWSADKDTTTAYYVIRDSIGYINLGKAKAKDLRGAYRKYRSMPVIIFDMRGYPPGIAPAFLPKMFSRRPKPVAAYYYPSKKYPGVFIKNKMPENYFIENYFTLIIKMLSNIKPKIAPTFNKIYDGEVIVLINEETASYAETVCMVIRAYAKHSTFVGTPTMGANGNVISFLLPGDIRVHFSSIDFHFPDGKQLQRIGIIPDIEVKTTIESVKKDTDEILERAVRYAQTGK